MTSEFACDVCAGLSRPQKELPSKYLYDELGSALFEAITVLPEYGLTRADQRLLERHAREIPDTFPLVAELGSGRGSKTRWILEALDCHTYFPIDLSPAALACCCRELRALSRVEPLAAPYLDGLREVGARRNGDPLLVLFLGSTIGNFDRRCAHAFLTEVRRLLAPGDGLLVGCDLVKPVPLMLEAYDDPSGVTAAFNLNLLGRINRELDGDFALRSFAHEARWDPADERIEMHLRARCDQCVTIRAADFKCEFAAGETIWTESSHKFHAEDLPAMARNAGFACEAQWIDREWPFAESFWRAV